MIIKMLKNVIILLPYGHKICISLGLITLCLSATVALDIHKSVSYSVTKCHFFS